MSDVELAVVEEQAVVFTEDLAQAIRQLGRITQVLEESPLSRRMIVMILHDASRVKKASIEKLLDTLPRLEELYFKRETEE